MAFESYRITHRHTDGPTDTRTATETVTTPLRG